MEQIFKEVRKEVIDETHDQQIPWESSSLIGDFYFMIEGKMTVTTAPLQGESAELEKERERLQEEEREELERLKLEIEQKKLEAVRSVWQENNKGGSILDAFLLFLRPYHQYRNISTSQYFLRYAAKSPTTNATSSMG